MEFETVIGLEIHAQLRTETKIFCGCRALFGQPPNTLVCPVCLGMPGSLPVLNKKAIELALIAGKALQCTISHESVFARKNYFYPDLPKGYQISQYDKPLCSSGKIAITAEGESTTIGITRIHLEEDAGKLIHDQDPQNSLFDANRCGVPLIEIVSEPELHSPAQAYSYLTALKQILEYCAICDCNMEEGSLRCDANISIRPRGATKLGTKVELKNMNSFRGVERALHYEIARQTDIVESGGTITQQTFLWDPDRNVTVPMRSKEEAHDYRYFPDPDLLPLVVSQSLIDEVAGRMPELPEARYSRFRSHYKLSEEHARQLTDTRDVADYFEAVAARCKDTQLAANWIMGEVLRLCKEKQVAISRLRCTPERLSLLLMYILDGTVSARAAKEVVDRLEQEDGDVAAIIQAMGLTQISDTGSLEAAARTIVENNPAEVIRYRGGEAKLFGFFVGQTMKATKGKGNPQEIGKILKKLLDTP